MAVTQTDTDVVIDVVRTVSAGPRVGAQSRYSSVPHPASGKTIDGFLWDRRTWPTELELEAVAFAPTIFDANTNFIEKEDFQSGIGNDVDGLVLSVDEEVIANKTLWVPQVNHGYFYIHDQEYYAFSDDMQIQYFHSGVLFSGSQTVDLKYTPKPSIPIEVRQYRFDRDLGEYIPSLDFRKVLEFTGEANPEFKVDYEENRILLNGVYTEDYCPPVSSSSPGVTDPTDVLALDFLGISDGLSTQYNTSYSPIDHSGVMEIWVYSNTASGLLWNEISPLASFSTSGAYEYKVDRELGLVFFDSAGYGAIPRLGATVAARYTKGVAAYYEPEYSRDTITALSANTNPLNNPNENGFITVAATNPSATSISLAADLPGTAPLDYILDIGNNTAEIIATVYDASGSPLEGQLVRFTIQDPQYGTFGSAGLSVSSLSKSDGKAKAFYNPPTTVDSFGAATTNVIHSGLTTVIRVNGLTAPTDISKIFLYQVQASDEVLGIDANTLDQYYEDFITGEGYAGPPPVISGDYTGAVSYEKLHRASDDLLSPITYDPTNSGTLSIGAKRIVLSRSNDVVNPDTGLIDPNMYAPLEPFRADDIGSQSNPVLEISYSGLLALPGNSGVRSYFIAAFAKTYMVASVTNENTRRRVVSNQIGINLQVPDEANGTYFANTLNTITSQLMKSTYNIDEVSDADIIAFSGQLDETWQAERIYISGEFESYMDWFRKTRRGDSALLGLSGVLYNDSYPARVPLGFRLQNDGITVASLLDQVTYFDPNDHLPTTYFSGIT